MKPDLLNYLVCPNCQGDLELHISEEEEGEVRSGFLSCHISKCQFPIVKFIPRFVDRDTYADSFSKQRLYLRRHFRYYQEDRSGDQLFLPTTGFKQEELSRGLTLEVGCGYGRFVDVVQRLGGKVIGIDLSTHSIELAQDFIGREKNVYLIQCDLFKLPFPKECFSHIYSIGVLHHTPNPRQAFEALVPYLRGGSKISILGLCSTK